MGIRMNNIRIQILLTNNRIIRIYLNPNIKLYQDRFASPDSLFFLSGPISCFSSSSNSDFKPQTAVDFDVVLQPSGRVLFGPWCYIMIHFVISRFVKILTQVRGSHQTTKPRSDLGQMKIWAWRLWRQFPVLFFALSGCEMLWSI